jgi:hypothetical protein
MSKKQKKRNKSVSKNEQTTRRYPSERVTVVFRDTDIPPTLFGIFSSRQVAEERIQEIKEDHPKIDFLVSEYIVDYRQPMVKYQKRTQQTTE